MLKDLKFEFKDVLALVFVALFALVLLCVAVLKITMEQDLRGFLINLMMLIAVFYFRSASPTPPPPPPDTKPTP